MTTGQGVLPSRPPSKPWLLRPRVLLAAVAVLATPGFLVTRSSLPGSSPRSLAIPESIVADCSRPVETEINQFLARAPDHVVIVFPPARCYAQDGSIEVNDRKGLTIDGRGSEFRAVSDGDTCRANWRIQGGSDITIENMVVRGVNTTGFDGPRWPDYRAQCQHGYAFDSVQGGRLLGSRASDTVGDSFAVGPDRRRGDPCVVPPNRNILIDRFHGFNAGRTASITHADGVTVQDSYLGDIFDNAIDIETDDDCMSARNVRILRNRFGRYHYAMVANTGPEKAGRGGGVEIVGNVTEAEPATCFPAIYVKPGPDHIRRNNLVIRDNRLKTMGDGIRVQQTRYVRIEGNSVSKNSASCGIDSTFVVRIDNSENVNVHGNLAVNGEMGGLGGGELQVDAATTGVTRDLGRSLPPLPPLPPLDDVPPAVEIATPDDGATVSGTVAIKAVGTGDNLRQGEFRIDGQLVKTDVGKNYDYMWDTATAAKGPHEVSVTLYNAFGVKSSTVITVMVG